jgi:hypothetical protein
MAPASALYLNDATWLVKQDTRLKLVHPDVPMDVARELNARSLRQHHQVGLTEISIQSLRTLPDVLLQG